MNDGVVITLSASRQLLQTSFATRSRGYEKLLPRLSILVIMLSTKTERRHHHAAPLFRRASRLLQLGASVLQAVVFSERQAWYPNRFAVEARQPLIINPRDQHCIPILNCLVVNGLLRCPEIKDVVNIFLEDVFPDAKC
jgi:hypothetical protein